eukprot:5831251-Amphidinium_carterae.2
MPEISSPSREKIPFKQLSHSRDSRLPTSTCKCQRWCNPVRSQGEQQYTTYGKFRKSRTAVEFVQRALQKYL